MRVALFAAVLAGGGVAVAAALRWHEAVARHLRGPASPRGIVSLALAGPGRSEAILRAWRRPAPGAPEDRGRLEAARSALRRDFALVAAYSVTIVALAWAGAGLAGWDWRVVAALGVVAGALDAVENVLLWRRVGAARAEGAPPAAAWSVRVTQAAAWAKFGALALAVVALVAVPGILAVAVLWGAGAAVAAARYGRARRRARAARHARERALLEERHGPIPEGPPGDVDDRRWRPGCDVVLKGGVTSGVIYPPALLRLAREFRFSSIGGTSAGAIAAGCAAAAEHGRQHPPGSPGAGFAGFARVHQALAEPVDGSPTRLRSLFQAERVTRPLLLLAEAAGGDRTRAHRALRVARAILAAFWLRTLLLALAAVAAAGLAGWALGLPLGGLAQRVAEPGLVATYLAGTWVEALGGEAATAVGRGAAVLLALALAGSAVVAVAAATGLVRAVRTGLPENLYGICSGSTVPGARTPALTEWLAGTLDALALGTRRAPTGGGRPPGPLTFGTLWGVPDVEPGDVRRIEGLSPPGADVVLELVTTCLTESRPLRLPYDLAGYWFAPSELRRLFPEPVVEHMVERGERLLDAPEQREPRPRAPDSGEPLVPVPARGDLPVVVAVRMSLSLPLVLSAVPLWHRHATDRLEHCWFSDGGVTSNFPIHLFDAPVPRRPTFGFNLRRWAAGVREPLVEVPGRFDEGADPYWRRIAEEDLPGFVSALMDSARAWTDETLSRRPGYRERIAHVYHSTGEGGMNLDMDAATIRALGARGYAAADVLARRYLPGAVAGDGVQVSWNSHRWARASITIAAVGEYLADLRAKWDDTSELAGQPSYWRLVAAGTGEGYPPEPFPLTRAQRMLLRVCVGALRATALPLHALEFGDGSDGSGRGVRDWGITLLRPSPRR